MFKYFPLVCCISILLSCKGSQAPVSELQLSDKQKVLYLDSTLAASTIIKDDMEHFFEHITPLDMAIQMQRNYSDTTTRKVALARYQDFLKRDVTDFTEEEKTFINKIFQEILELCEQVNPSIFPKEIWLIKSHGKHYGSSAYYTRENGVIIPKQALESQNHMAFLGVMLHELFHIYSRLNPDKRKELYQRIGFKKCGQLSDLQMNESLRNRLLLNPDGIDYTYAIQLKSPEGEQVQAIPLILANETQYVNNKKDFFNYIHFDLYPIKPPYSRLIQVKSDNEGFTQAGMTRWPDFYRQIGDNTNYIIHPDEILADNFMHLIMSKKDTTHLQSFSKEGIELIKDVERIIAE